VRVADYEDVSSLRRAFAGIDELVLVSSDGEASAVMRHHENAIEAAAVSNVRHVTFTSIVDTDESSPFYFSPAYRDAERRLVASRVPSTILKCGLYSDFVLEHWLLPSQSSGEVVLPTGQGRVAPISRDDVATAVASVAVKHDDTRGVYSITGARALRFDEIVASYRERIASEVRYRSGSIDEYMAWASAHLADPWPHAFSTLCASIAAGHYGGVSEDFMAITGREPESFRDFLLRKK
jgi:NAD(P)H dehydrogenase (quinone)